jgi:hypothetical protein
MAMNSPRSAVRVRRRMAERARPVTARLSQCAWAAGRSPRRTSIVSPFSSMVRSGRSCPLMRAPIVVSPISVWTA